MILLPLVSSLKHICSPEPAVHGCRDRRLQTFVMEGILNQKWHEFLKIIIRYDKKQEQVSFSLLTFHIKSGLILQLS